MECARGLFAVLLAGWLGGCSCAAIDGPSDERGEAGRAPVSTSTTVHDVDATTSSSVVPEPTSSTVVTAGSSTSVPQTTTSVPPVPDPEPTYTWSLPLGDRSISFAAQSTYRIVQAGDCEAAQTELNLTWEWFHHPRAVLLYQAAVEFCRGDDATARRLFERAGSEYGWIGIEHPYIDCNVYRAALSVLQQQPSEAITCPGGRVEGSWTPEENPVRDDPRLPRP